MVFFNFKILKINFLSNLESEKLISTHSCDRLVIKL